MVDSPRPPSSPQPPNQRRELSEYTPFTNRAVVLGVVMAVFVVLYAVPIREFVQQRSEISALQAEKTRTTQNIKDLNQRLKQWNDPAFVSAQARQRLQYVMPGEVSYVVLDPNEGPTPIINGRPASGSQGAWYSIMWRSVQTADQQADTTTNGN